MTVKSVIEIDVQDEQFKAFKTLFDEHVEKLEELPDDWKKVADATGAAGDEMEDFGGLTDHAKESLLIAAIQADAIGKSIGKAIAAQKEFSTAARQGKNELAEMAKHAKTLSGEVFGIGKFLLKMGVLGVGTAAAGTILSGFGLDRLAQSSLNMQGHARSIGVTQGQLSSFETAYGRYGGDASLLRNVADSQADLSKVGYLAWATGKNVSQVQTEGAVTAAQDLMQRAHDWWNKTPASMRNFQTLQATGLDHFFSFDQVRSFGAASQSELSDAASTYAKNIKNFNVSDRTNDAWFKFVQQIETAGKTIETDLTNRLGVLAPELTHFIDGLSEDAKVLIDEVLTPANLKTAGDALQDFTRFIASGELKSDLKGFGDAISNLTDGIKQAYGWYEKIFGDDSQGKGGLHSAVHDFLNPGDAVNDAFSVGAIKEAGGDLSRARNLIAQGAIDQKKENRLDYLGNKYQLPGGVLDSVWAVESSRGKNAGPSGTGALGPFQFLAPTGKDWGLATDADRMDFYKSSSAAARYLSSLQRHYHGNIEQALAAYKWGIGNVDSDIAKNGSNWRSGLDADTRTYLSRIQAALTQNKAIGVKLDVTINNRTGSNVAVSANAARSTVSQ